MPHSEIDDIFAAKSAKGPAVPLIPPKAKGKTKASDEDINILTKQKKKKRQRMVAKTLQHCGIDPTDGPSAVSNAKRKLPEPETVVDISTALPAPTKRLKTLQKGSFAGPGKTGQKQVDDEEKFRDSRGTGPRRKTNDGFSIYKEDELNLGSGGGDTALCPFDCDCCF